MSTLSRRTKWRPTPSPLRSPMILHFPRSRRTRRRNRGNLENGLRSSFERRERVKEIEDEQEGHNSAEEEEEKWRFRAECDLLRMEREKLEKNSINLQRTLRSALQTLVSARKKIVEGGKNTNAAVLEEEIEDLSEKIEELQRVKGKVCVNEIAKESRIDNKSSENKCSGRCKAMVLRVAEQVRAETEQWSQMQRMLEKVRGEMEELHESRDYWERQAHNSSSQIQSLRHTVEQWKEKALDYKQLVSELELANQRGDNLKKEEKKDAPPPPLSLAKQLAKEKRSFIRSLKENRHTALDKGSNKELSEDGTRRRRRRPHSNSNGGVASKRSPLRDIVNSSLLPRENHRIAFDYRSPESSRIRESFRK